VTEDFPRGHRTQTVLHLLPSLAEVLKGFERLLLDMEDLVKSCVRGERAEVKNMC